MESPKGKSFLFARYGYDRDNISIHEKITIKRTTILCTGKRSLECQIAQVNQESFWKSISQEFDELVKNGKELISDQRKIKTNRIDQDSRREISSSLTIWENKKDYFSSIKSWNDKALKLLEGLSLVKNKVKGYSAISIQSKLQKIILQ